MGVKESAILINFFVTESMVNNSYLNSICHVNNQVERIMNIIKSNTLKFEISISKYHAAALTLRFPIMIMGVSQEKKAREMMDASSSKDIGR